MRFTDKMEIFEIELERAFAHTFTVGFLAL